MQLHFTVTPERIRAEKLTVGELVMLEDREEATTKAIRDLVARFMSDPEGNKFAVAEAKRVLNRLLPSELMEAFEALGKQLTDGAVPPESASASS
jgi:hypothetical protein